MRLCVFPGDAELGPTEAMLAPGHTQLKKPSTTGRFRYPDGLHGRSEEKDGVVLSRNERLVPVGVSKFILGLTTHFWVEQQGGNRDLWNA